MTVEWAVERIMKVCKAKSCMHAKYLPILSFFIVAIEMFISVNNFEKHNSMQSANWLTVSGVKAGETDKTNDKMLGGVTL